MGASVPTWLFASDTAADDTETASDPTPPPLLEPDRSQIEIFVDALFRRMDGEDTPSATMPAELIVRESSRQA
jgi:DNA-binding LacI/PurR family transcriptional regulator